MRISLFADGTDAPFVPTDSLVEVMHSPSSVDSGLKHLGWRLIGTFVKEDAVGTFVHYASPQGSENAGAIYLSHEHRLVIVKSWLDTAKFFEATVVKVEGLAAQTLPASDRQGLSPDRLN